MNEKLKDTTIDLLLDGVKTKIGKRSIASTLKN